MLVFLVAPIVWWFRCGESFLSLTRRLPAEVLVVEGWIGSDGIRAAAVEFEQHGYKFLVTSGGPAEERWGERQRTYAELAKDELVGLGFPEDRIIVAPAGDTEILRTYKAAAAVRGALQAKGLRPKALNVFTLGSHARRSRLIFARIHAPETKVGVISWTSPSQDGVAWWRSSSRAKNLLTETAGYAYEALLSSGRDSNSPGGIPIKTVQDPNSAINIGTPSLK
jgi:hypothetical protein